ncbi:MAG: hypothetical protein M1821_003893 [Bathelium mastoideum]|nr:MAG: hypothetical protein M1821_003893 [Bathelium mastoideum]
MGAQQVVQPSLETVRQVLLAGSTSANPPNLVPLCTSISAEFLTPSSIYLKVAAKSVRRYSFVGTDPRKVIKTGPGHGVEADPLPILQQELSQCREAQIPGLSLPSMTGGAVGYVGYDCVRYFEPTTRAGMREEKDILQVPESFFMLFDTIIAVDHFSQTVKVITYLRVTGDLQKLEEVYADGAATLRRIVDVLQKEDVPMPYQPPIIPNQQFTSNIGQEGYENHVRRLKEHISQGDIIQCVPSQRFRRPTSLHPFNIYRHLRTVNPSPYLFFIDCEAFQIVGASPELLVKADGGRIITHPIAGTVKRGKTLEEDEALADALRSSLKDRAEHVMLVDLARKQMISDINRVSEPLSTRVDRLMVVEKFSHVQHLVSQVSGVLRPGQTRFDAFRSVFPAGTVSGAPKVRAMQLIAELEKEKRGVYAGAVGYFGYREDAMDTCIALRTMVVKDGAAYLQAGGGIVFDSDPYEEYLETINKLGASMQCIASAEEKHLRDAPQQAADDGRRYGENRHEDANGERSGVPNGPSERKGLDASARNGESQLSAAQGVHIDLAAG